MDKKGLVSVIVPVYNAERFLGNTIYSITAQTYKNLEIIIINDGSTDNSGFICDELARSDTRIKIVHIENQGVSNARNMGIELSSGEYISFVDADDLVEKEMINDMVNVMVAENVDMVITQYLEKSDVIGREVKGKMSISGFCSADSFRDLVVKDFFSRSKNRFNSACWGKLLKSTIIKHNGITFDANLKYGEDSLFILECIMRADRFFVMPDYHPYLYFKHEGATTAKYELNRYQKKKYMIEKIKDIPGLSLPSNYELIYFLYALETYYTLTFLPFKNNSKLIRSELRAILSDPNLISSFQYVDKKRLSKRDKFVSFLFKKRYLTILLLLLRLRKIVKKV